MAMHKTEKIQYHRAIVELEDTNRALIQDEIISITLFALAHIKDEKSRLETLASAHTSMNDWAGDDDKKKRVMSSLLKSDAILAHGINLLRDKNPAYDPDTTVA